MARRRRYIGWGKPYATQKGRWSGWFINFYERGAVSTYRIVKLSEHKR